MLGKLDCRMAVNQQAMVALISLDNRSGIAESGWRGVSFIGSTKRVLDRCVREAGVVLTAEATARLDALPETFLDFIAAPQRFAVQWPDRASVQRNRASTGRTIPGG